MFPADLSWNIVVLIYKGNTDTQGICLIEVLCKVVEVIIDTWIKTVVTFHDILYGFRSSRGTGIDIVELKMAQELSSIDQDSLFLVLLDI